MRLRLYVSNFFVSSLVLVATLARPQQVTASDEFPQPTNTERSTGKSMSPEEVCRSVRLPQGFRLTCFASEPDVQNPIAITTDDRGRLWVAENYTWAGADAGNFDQNLRDRIVILEDTDGDGKQDKRTVFYDRAERLTSIQVGMGGVWLLCSPQLSFIPDRNRDDIPDGQPEVVLDGFDLESSTHTVANGLKWGPDGWLYGRQGILGTSHVGVPGAADIDRIEFNTGVWRYHPTRRVCEVVMHGMTNPWGFDYDEFGETFVSNTVIGHLWHVIPGARTERMSGQDFNPHAYQLVPQVADHVHWNTAELWNDVRIGVTESTSAAGGGHAHTGLLIYQGDNWPTEYRGRIFTMNIHGRRINSDLLSRTAVGFTAKHAADMCFISDPWFRGMDLISGADGAVYIADWSDTGECHEMGGVHRTSGRIYRLVYGQTSAKSTVNLANASDAQLVQMQLHSNDWIARQSRLILQERAAKNALEVPTVRKRLLELFNENANPVIRIRAMWSVWLTQCMDEKWLQSQLQHPDEHIRVWAVRLLAEMHAPEDTTGWIPILTELRPLAIQEKSGLVILYLTAALQKMPPEMRWNIGNTISMRPEEAFANDKTLGVLLWLGLEPLVAARPKDSLELVRKTTFPLIRENIARRLALEIDQDILTVAKLFDLAIIEPAASGDIVRGVAAALNGRKNAPVPANWMNFSSRLLSRGDDEMRDSIHALGVIFKDDAILASLQRSVDDSNATASVRNRAIQLLVFAQPPGFSATLRRLIKDPDLALEAIRGLAQYNDPEAPVAILNNYKQFTPDNKIAAINTLASRASYARELIRALEEKRLTPADISAFQARQLTALGDSEVNGRLRALWGDARQTPEDKRNLIQDLRTVYTPRMAGADIENGRMVYSKTCASCHVLFGQGTKIGPDLTGSNRKSLDYLLENIVDPSAIVGAEFRVTVFVLANGRVLNGIVREQNDRTITIDTPEGQQVIDRQEIDESIESDKSLMPEGALTALTDAEICNLLAYLMSN